MFHYNEAVLKALFKVKDSELTLAKAITVAVEKEAAAKVAKATVHGSTGRETEVVNKVQDKPTSLSSAESSRSNGRRKTDFPKGTCPRCGSREVAAGVIGYTVRPNFRSGGPYSLREYGPPRTQLPREYGPPDRVPSLYKTN